MRQRVETAGATRAAHPPAEPAKSAGELQIAQPMPKQELRSVPVRPENIKLYPPKIAKALLAITREVDPVTKAGYNSFHKYNYQKWEDILEALGPLIAKHGLIIIQSEIAHGGFERDLIEVSYEFTIVNEDGDVWPDKPTITSICKVRDAKGTIDDKAASKCHTQAHKYAMVQIFKIRVAEMADADSDGKPPARRPAPSPDGKIAPHYIQGVEGETAQTWTAKFIGFIKKATSKDELDQWENLNGKLLDLVQERDIPAYNTIVDAMNAREATFTPAPAHPPAASNGGFPGDKPVQQDQDAGIAIPLMLDRQLTDGDRDWLLSLGDAYNQCNTAEEIGSEQESIMLPSEGRVSDHAWLRAVEMTNNHLERVGGKR